MPEAGGDIPNPIDQNPGQAFTNVPIEVDPQISDQNPNQLFKEVKQFREEEYTLWFGDLITFGDITDQNAEQSVIVNVGNSRDFTVAHLSKTEDGEYVFSP